MARDPRPDSDADGYFDPEGPGAHDHHLFDSDAAENDYIPCPHCGRDVLAFSQWCPHCGQAFATEAWREAGSTVGARAGVVAVILIVVLLAVWLL